MNNQIEILTSMKFKKQKKNQFDFNRIEKYIKPPS